MNKSLREMAIKDTITEFTFNDTEYKIVKFSWEGFDKYCWELQRGDWTVIWQAEPDTKPCETIGIILNLLKVPADLHKVEDIIAQEELVTNDALGG